MRSGIWLAGSEQRAAGPRPRPFGQPQRGGRVTSAWHRCARGSARPFSIAFEHADSGGAFRAALEEHGLILANGDKRDCFVVVDEAAGIHALNKSLTGITLTAMRERMADLDRAQLPSVAEAKAMQRERQNAREERADGKLSAAPQIDIDQTSAAAPIRVAEPPAPNWDRDAADRAWLERVENAGVAHAIEQSSRQPAISMSLSDIKVPAGEQPVTPPRAFTPEPEQGLRSAWSFGDHLLGSVTQCSHGVGRFCGEYDRTRAATNQRPGDPRCHGGGGKAGGPRRADRAARETDNAELAHRRAAASAAGARARGRRTSGARAAAQPLTLAAADQTDPVAAELWLYGPNSSVSSVTAMPSITAIVVAALPTECFSRFSTYGFGLERAAKRGIS